ncbi:TetR family transcriptional regulator [Salinifilum aidingensis]
MPQQRRARVTRGAILLAAAEEFERIGYPGATLGAILRRSGVTKGAFYFHFDSKEAVAGALVGEYEEVCARLWRYWAARRVDPLSTAVGLTRDAAEALERDVRVCAGLYLACVCDVAPAESAAPEGVVRLPLVSAAESSVVSRLLRRSAERGQLRAEVDPLVVARLVHDVLLGLWFDGAPREGGVARVTETWRALLRGVAAPGVRAELCG